jgi:hypothetical protein
MKPHPRIRKSIKWGGAAATVLLVVVWFGSGWFYVSWFGQDSGTGIVSGQWFIVARGVGETVPTGWHRGRHVKGPAFHWWFEDENRGLGARAVRVPIWSLAAPFLLVAFVAWRLDTAARRRERAHLCPKCHYDRTGLGLSARCPECGSSPAEPAAHA